MKYFSAITLGLIAFVAQADQIFESEEREVSLSGEARVLNEEQFDLDLLSKAEIARGMTTSEHYQKVGLNKESIDYFFNTQRETKTKKDKKRTTVELTLKPGKEDTYNCAGEYIEFTDEINGSKFFSNTLLRKVIFFYVDRWQITSWDQYTKYMCNCNVMGAGLHTDQADDKRIKKTEWNDFNITYEGSVTMAAGIATTIALLTVSSF